MSYREEMMKELGNANRMLQKHEDKILKGEIGAEDLDFFKERVSFWSESVIELRKFVFQSQKDIQSVGHDL